MSDRYHVMLVYTVSKHATARGAQIACRRLQGSEDDLAMVVEMPEEKEKQDGHPRGKTASGKQRAKSSRKRVRSARS